MDGLPFFTVSETAPRKPSEIEREVIALFEQFRNPLLRYVFSFGISMHDAEEVVQEVFLSLFRHLQLGRSRTNLRGWIFRVAHNHALRQRGAEKKVRVRTSPSRAPSSSRHASSHTSCSSRCFKRPQACRRRRILVGQKPPRRPRLQHPQDAFKAGPVDAHGRPRLSLRRFGSGSRGSVSSHCRSLNNSDRFLLMHEVHQTTRLLQKSQA
jgi:hypothetical protein